MVGVMPVQTESSTSARFDAALAAHMAGRLAEARDGYRALLADDPDDAACLHLSGLIAVQTGSPETAVPLIRRAMARDPGQAPHHNSLGLAFMALNRPDDAVREYRAAAAARPDSPEIHNNLAAALAAAGAREDATRHYRRAAVLAPDNPDIARNLACALIGLAPPAEVEAWFHRAIAAAPDHPATHARHGIWLRSLGRTAEAREALERAVSLDPNDPRAWHDLALVSQDLNQTDAAIALYRRALTLAPDRADTLYNLGCLLHGDGRTDEALACHARAIRADPTHGPARIALCMAELPVLPETEHEAEARRARYLSALDHLTEAVSAPDIARAVAAAIGSAQPFFLPYLGQDEREAQRRQGRLMCALAAGAWQAPPAPAPAARIRLGLVSGCFRDHTVYRLFLDGWLTHLDRSRFEVTGFHTAVQQDAFTTRASGLCDRFVSGLPSPGAWRDAVVGQDILIYPEIGMDPVVGFLAAHRLAPVQCVAWGHPVTTGMPSIDHFLSADLMEPPDGEQHYSEALVRLPNLGVCFSPDRPPVAPADRASLGLPADAVVYWSGQALYKYQPRHDALFPRIARSIPRARFVFVGFAKSANVTRMFQDRLDRAFAAHGLNAADHCHVLAPMNQDGFIAAMGAADVILDTPEWSGGRSTLDGLAWDTPVVTLPGRFMRGRHTAAILRRIGCEATIATGIDDYLAIAIRLGRDPAWRAEVRRTMAAGTPRAFGDVAAVRALEAFLLSVGPG